MYVRPHTGDADAAAPASRRLCVADTYRYYTTISVADTYCSLLYICVGIPLFDICCSEQYVSATDIVASSMCLQHI
jgi:hypothetical protein